MKKHRRILLLTIAISKIKVSETVVKTVLYELDMDVCSSVLDLTSNSDKWPENLEGSSTVMQSSPLTIWVSSMYTLTPDTSNPNSLPSISNLYEPY